MSRAQLVERSVAILDTADNTAELTSIAARWLTLCRQVLTVTPSLPSLAILQGVCSRCSLVGEVLARAAPSYLGQVAALFRRHDNKLGKGYKIIN